MTILIVEDELKWQDSYQEWLTLKKHEVKVAGTKAEALNLIWQYSFSLAIVDINLSVSHGNQDGLEVIRMLREHQPRTKIIIVSGSITPDLADDLRKKGLDYIPRNEFHYKEFINFVQQKVDEYNANG